PLAWPHGSRTPHPRRTRLRRRARAPCPRGVRRAAPRRGCVPCPRGRRGAGTQRGPDRDGGSTGLEPWRPARAPPLQRARGAVARGARRTCLHPVDARGVRGVRGALVVRPSPSRTAAEMIRVTFLGTAASRPTVGRNVSAILINREGELLMFDCGEGTQRQMMRFGTGFTVRDIFVTHMHADHFLGIVGLLRTMGVQRRQEPTARWAPVGGGAFLRDAVNLGVERVSFGIEIHELEPDHRVERDGYDIIAYRTQHGGRSLGYVLAEHQRRGRFNPERARELGVPEGPLFGKLHRGEPVEVNGRIVRPEDVVGPPRPGRKIVYTGDTRPTRRTV